MSTEKQHTAAKEHRESPAAAKSEKTISQLPGKTRTSVGKKGAEATKRLVDRISQ